MGPSSGNRSPGRLRSGFSAVDALQAGSLRPTGLSLPLDFPPCAAGRPLIPDRTARSLCLLRGRAARRSDRAAGAQAVWPIRGVALPEGFRAFAGLLADD